jgi:hypothetical protein
MLSEIVRFLLVALSTTLITVSGCGVFHPRHLSTSGSSAEQFAGFTYVPVDPIAVTQIDSNLRYVEANEPLNIRHLLPDNAVRTAVEDISGSGGASFLVGNAASKGSRLRLTVDYIMADTMPVRMIIIERTVLQRVESRSGEVSEKAINIKLVGAERIAKNLSDDGVREIANTMYRGLEERAADQTASIRNSHTSVQTVVRYNLYERTIPVYVGVGLRVTADVTTLTGNVTISGLGGIGVDADAGKLSGSLVVQTIGINGPSVSAALPIQSELNRTTAMNAVVAVGSVKALLYDEETRVAPRVLGFYLPFVADRSMINSIVNALVSEPLEWEPGGLRGMKAAEMQVVPQPAAVP